jgi:hypothetical protein
VQRCNEAIRRPAGPADRGRPCRGKEWTWPLTLTSAGLAGLSCVNPLAPPLRRSLSEHQGLSPLRLGETGDLPALVAGD